MTPLALTIHTHLQTERGSLTADEIAHDFHALEAAGGAKVTINDVRRELAMLLAAGMVTSEEPAKFRWKAAPGEKASQGRLF